MIGNYRIVSELGKGGMGMVYRAEHTQLGRPAALKMLLPQLSNDPAIVQRFFNEARAASAIDHPGMVEIYEFGTHTDGRAYLVMALLKGESLAQCLERGPLAPLDGAAIVAQVLSVIAAAHAGGIVHRDLKPDNIFLVPNELVAGGVQVKLLDFGIAKLADEQGGGLKTQTGALIGTPAYMSPEQCMGRSDLDHRTDLYAIGCILFHVLVGRPPFVSDQGTGMLIAAHLRDAPADPRSFDPRIPDALAAITLRLLEKDPAARFQSAVEVRAALAGAGVVAPTTTQHAVTGGPSGLRSVVSPSAQRFVGREAYDATTAPTTGSGRGNLAPAPTTASGSAAQLVGAPAPVAKPGGKRPYVIVGGLLFALAGVGVFAMVSRGGDEPSTAAVTPAPSSPPPSTSNHAVGSNAAPAPAPAPPPATPAPVALAPVAPPSAALAGPPPAPVLPAGALAPSPVAEIECPHGQAETDDTRGHCCWPGQAWSSTKSACVGVPTCPPGFRVAREACIALPAEADPSSPVPTVAASAAPELSLDASVYPPSTEVHIRFAVPLSAPKTSRAWVAIAPVGSLPSIYSTWKYVPDGAIQIQLKAPAAEGAYEVRLHTDYPAKSFNIARTAPFAVRADAEPPAPAAPTPLAKQRFTPASTIATVGMQLTIRFGTQLRALPGEQFWVTTVKAGSLDTVWGKYAYVPDSARKMSIDLPTEPGDYEIRLHANYPKQSTNVVYRVPIRLDPK
ncbi:MAG: serine/threonine protein kinase [Myxococcales bacterium]|nr:serine/threonine protein kinase [Myxococcales bacterium]